MSAHPACKFKPDEVRRIRWRFRNGESARALGREHNATGQSILNMVYGKTYTDCGGPISPPKGYKGENNGNSRLTKDDVILARALHRDGVSIVSIAQTIKCDESTASRVCNNDTWIHLSDLPPPLALTKDGAEPLIAMLQAKFPNQANITPAAFIETLHATEVWYSRHVQAGKIKTHIRMGVTQIKMSDAIAFLLAEYGTN